MSEQGKYVHMLPVGLVQTTVNHALAWNNGMRPKMSSTQDAHVWRELCRAMRSFKDGKERPRIVVIPELSLPRTRLDDFERLVTGLNVIAIAGVDYRMDSRKNLVRNEGMVFVPKGFWKERGGRSCVRILFGKSHAAPAEIKKLAAMSPSWSFMGDHNVYIFDCGEYGQIGVSICYDFMDIERALMFRGHIHHLFVLAYNRDLGMFRSLADSLSRTIFCNVVVCNTGFHGGSVAVSPYYEAHRRTLYSHGGKGLFTSQVIHLPVEGLEDARAVSVGSAIGSVIPRVFKDPPPGLNNLLRLTVRSKKL